MFITQSIRHANVTGIAVFPVPPADQVAPILSIHTTTSRRTDLLLPSGCIAGSHIPARYRKAAGNESQDTIGEPNFCNVSFPPDLRRTWARDARISII